MLAVADARWDIQAEWQLRGKAQPEPHDQVRFGLELSSLDPDWQTAIARARRLDLAQIDGIRARLELQRVELHFATHLDETVPHGEAWFAATIDQVIPFPRNLDDTEFVRALAQAGTAAGDLLLQADEIEVTERYWIFPIQNIGQNGVIVDRANGGAFMTSGSLDRLTWIWAHEHGLLHEPAGDIVVERIVDPDRAFAALRGFARVAHEELQALPVVLEGCATWMAARHLKDANGALTWSVASRPR